MPVSPLMAVFTEKPHVLRKAVPAPINRQDMIVFRPGTEIILKLFIAARAPVPVSFEDLPADPGPCTGNCRPLPRNTALFTIDVIPFTSRGTEPVIAQIKELLPGIEKRCPALFAPKIISVK